MLTQCSYNIVSHGTIYSLTHACNLWLLAKFILDNMHGKYACCTKNGVVIKR